GADYLLANFARRTAMGFADRSGCREPRCCAWHRPVLLALRSPRIFWPAAGLDRRTGVASFALHHRPVPVRAPSLDAGPIARAVGTANYAAGAADVERRLHGIHFDRDST